MNVRIGDIVKFISEKLEGKVTGIIDQNTVNVYCEEYGFEIPASVNDLLVVRSDLSMNTTDDKQKQNQKSIPVQSADTLYLAITSDNFQHLDDSRFTLHFINDTALTCLYSATTGDGEKYTGISAGNCNANETITLATHSLKEVDKIKSIRMQVIFFHKGNYIPRKAIDIEIKISAPSLLKSGSYKHTKWFSDMTFMRPLDKENIDKEDIPELILAEQDILEKKDIPTPHRSTSTVNSNLIEIDLHIDQLLDTTAGMENKDILEYQLDVFRKTLDQYKLRRGLKIIFIHGKGDGVLHQRILWELQTKYKRFQHQDASFKQYGYGATMITVK